MRVPFRGSDVRRKFIGDEFQGRVVREVEGAALEMRFASNRRNVGSNPMLSAHFLNKNSTAVFTCPVLFLYVNDVPGYFHADPSCHAFRGNHGSDAHGNRLLCFHPHGFHDPHRCFWRMTVSLFCGRYIHSISYSFLRIAGFVDYIAFLPYNIRNAVPAFVILEFRCLSFKFFISKYKFMYCLLWLLLCHPIPPFS
mgnify:FL=1